jgi:prepilin-type N-terminal cleavage/methylation domain-containing protein
MQRGFTLVELIVVIAILSVFAGMAIPQINRSMAAWDLDNAARQLEIDLRWTQQWAINSDTTIQPVITFFNAPPYGYMITLNNKVIKPIVVFPSTVKIDGQPQPLAFGIDGKPSGGFGIQLTNSLSSRKLLIDSWTGRIRIE